MHALVTGGGGFLGLYIVEQLLADGHNVRVLCRGSYDTLQRPGIEVVQADVRNADEVTAACEGMEAVFHVAAIPGVWGKWQTYHSINTVGTENIIAGCHQAGVERLIYTSSPSVVFDGSDHVDADESLPYPTDWLCHYPHSKALAEQAVIAANSSSFRTLALRPHLIWGPRDNHLIPRLIQKAKSGRLKRVGDGTNVVSVSYVENTAAAHVQSEQSLRESPRAAGKAYFINEPESVNLWEWIDQILKLADLPPIKGSISASTAERIGSVMEFFWKVLPGEPPMTRFVAQQLAGSHSYSIESARNAFGYQPICSMAEGMQRLAADLNAAH